MTQEEKAKAYDEALEDMKVIYPNLKGDIKLAVEHAFPELQKSEDERIPRLLHKLLCAEVSAGQFEKHGLTVDDALYWLEHCLEKQKEQKPTFDDYLKATPAERRKMSMTAILEKEQKPAERSEEKEKQVDDYAAEIIKWEDEHTDWDREVIRATAYHFFNLQPKQEWSEEDTHKTERLLYLIASNKGFNREHRDEALGIVKSLRPNRWKPSEEQKGALDYAYCELFKRKDVGHNILGPLSQLCDDLKKLM